MADPLLTSLCAICHISAPKYKCPRCGIRTCSLPCIRKHKSWSDCSGERDPTLYIPPKQLRTAAGIDHDYNFLHKLERTLERSEKNIVEERGLVRQDELRQQPLTTKEVRWKTGRDGRKRKVVVTRELREARGGRRLEKSLANRLSKLGVRMLCAPTGMQRQKENKTTLNGKTGKVNWQVEWLKLEHGGQTTTRRLAKAFEDVPLYKAYHEMEEARNRPAKGQQTGRAARGGRVYAQIPYDSTWNTAMDMLQEPSTGRWIAAAAVLESGVWMDEKDQVQRESFDYFLDNPRQKSDEPKVLTRLEADECLVNVLRDTSVLEFPTVYVLRRGETLPPGFVLGAKDHNNNQPQGLKRKDGPGRRGPRSGKRRKQGSGLEEGEVGSDDDADDKSSVGTGGNDEDDDGPSVGLEVGDVVAEESFGEDDEDGDSPTSSSGTDSDDDSD